jgi:hypothetical protein
MCTTDQLVWPIAGRLVLLLLDVECLRCRPPVITRIVHWKAMYSSYGVYPLINVRPGRVSVNKVA